MLHIVRASDAKVTASVPIVQASVATVTASVAIVQASVATVTASVAIVTESVTLAMAACPRISSGEVGSSIQVRLKGARCFIHSIAWPTSHR
jgi:hypothetical protein